jgi:hypothetical protein
MRAAIAVLFMLSVASFSFAAEFKSDEANNALAAYESAVKAAMTKYGQDLAKSKAALDQKREFATDAIVKETLQKESDLLTEELARLHAELNGGAAAGEPKDLKTDSAKNARAVYEAALKAAKLKYTQDLANAQRAVLGKNVMLPKNWTGG